MSTLTIPLPKFGRQPIDDQLPDGSTVTPAATGDQRQDQHPMGEQGPGPRPEQESPDAGRQRPPALSPGPRTRTPGLSRGDAKVAGEVIGGLIGILCAIAFTWAGRRGRIFRQPTAEQIDSVAGPLGAIAARHLPTDAIAPDVIDATRAVRGAHLYILDGPLLTRPATEPSGDDLP